MYKDFIIEKEIDKELIGNLIKNGANFKEINKAAKDNCFTFKKFLHYMPILKCMFKEFLEDEASGEIKDWKDYYNAIENYFGNFGWYEIELQENGGDLTEDEIREDFTKMLDYTKDVEKGYIEFALNCSYGGGI